MTGLTDRILNYLCPRDINASITTTKGSVRSGSITCKKFGPIIYLTFVAIKPSGTVAAGSDLFAGTVSSNIRGAYARSNTRYNGEALPVYLNADGSIRIVNGKSSISDNLTMRIALMFMI